MERGLDNLPDLPFEKILKFLSLKDILALSLVSSGVRERIRQCSDTLQTVHLRGIDYEKLRLLADQVLEIKGISICYLKNTRGSSEEVDKWEQCSQLLLNKYPQLENLSIHDGSKYLSKQFYQSLLCHQRMKYLSLGDHNLSLQPGLSYSKILHTLKLDRQVGLTHEDICTILSEFGDSLNTLHIKHSNLSGEGLSKFTSTLPRIKELKISGWYCMSDKGFEEWMRICGRSLKVLDVLQARRLTDQGLSSIFALAPHLTSLNMQCTEFTGTVVKNLCLELEVLALNYCRSLTDLGLGNIIRLAPNLTTLLLIGTGITGEGFFLVQKLNRLQIIVPPLRKKGEAFSVYSNLRYLCNIIY